MEWEALKLLATGSDMLSYAFVYILWRLDRRLLALETKGSMS